MTTFFTRGICLLLVAFCFEAVRGQENFMAYWEPEIEFSYDVVPFYSHKFSVEKRSLVYRESPRFDIVQFDLAHFSELKVLDNQSVALGIQYRTRAPFGDEKDEFRLTEQYSLSFKSLNFRTGHRFRVEQRFSGRPVEHRFRYRLAVDFPLEGSRLDIGETFFTGSWENLLTLANTAEPSYEQRFSVEIGLLANEKITFSGGLQYRLDNYTRSAEHNLFILSSASIEF
ncbi:MAG TPA: DUF2490 domain-containing protein [Pricia sp.]|nr:DUF2490 domain-containing protein [Pricia sp.]